MAFVGLATVTSSSDAATLTFTDNSTGIVTLVSRTLVVTDSNGNIVSTQNMGAAITATVGIFTDVYYSFVETIVDANGTYIVPVKFTSNQFYNIAQSKLAAVLIQSNSTNLSNSLTIARECINAANNFALTGDGTDAQISLTAANYYINNPTY
jgi:hypothetical protein